ncbi:MAG: hypothetical protein OXG83_14925 [Acidobacteria bacterium]|nr:hypothetical protein [Acidobacteriota bacterium]
MNGTASIARPDWVSDDLFPFESRFLDLPPDHRMHYIDEGEGEPIVFVHGNPAWSFLFRHPIRELRSEFRCVALDHIGFGLSSRSARREDHRPESHARQIPTGAKGWREAIAETYTHLRFPRGTRWLLSPYRESGGSGWWPNWYVVAWRWVRGWKFVPHDKEP